MKKTLSIAYNGGAYGTYLEWVLNSLLSDSPIQDPFTDHGNSHRYKGNLVQNLQGFQKLLASGQDFSMVRLHPKVDQHDNLQENLEFILDNCDRLILLYPDKSHELMCICNYMTKIWQGDPYRGPLSYVNAQDIYQGYNITPGKTLDSLPIWIRREHMSFNVFTSWHSQVEWYFPDHWNHPRAIIITTKQLFEDFHHQLSSIEKFWDVKYRRNIDDMMPWHEKMISLQSHLGKDQLCSNIIESVIDDNASPFDYGEICLTSQAWIQYQLRMLGYELLCHDLNDFPTNTETLKKVVYISKQH